MSRHSLSSKTLAASLEHSHGETLSHIDEFTIALQEFCYEGKVSHDKNLKKIQQHVAFFQDELLPHMALDEKVVFPFLEKHIPRLEPVLHFLKAEHIEFRESLSSFEKIFKTLSSGSAVQDRRSIEQLRERGLYLICLIRNHIHSENESVYRVMNEDLKDKEKEEFSRLAEIKKGRGKR